MIDYEAGPLPTEVPGVIDRLGDVVAWCRDRKSPIGYFAAVYRDVTKHILDEIEKGPAPSGRFEKPDRMREFDVTFANRFISAFDAWHAQDGTEISHSWRFAFDTAERERVDIANGSRFARLPVLVHLLLGVNAHMNLDLGCAASTVAPGASIADLSSDFTAINEVLDSITPHQKLAAERVEPLTRLVDRWGWLSDFIIDSDIEIRRASSWKFANELAESGGTDHNGLVRGRDEKVHRQGLELIDFVQNASWRSPKHWLIRPLVLLDTFLTAPIDEVIDAFGEE